MILLGITQDAKSPYSNSPETNNAASITESILPVRNFFPNKFGEIGRNTYYIGGEKR